MQKVIDTIDKFKHSNSSALQNLLTKQFQEHFNFLVEQINSIEKIEFSFYQVDQDMYIMTDFIVNKNNGYIYHYCEEGENEDISHWEFFKSEIAIIDAFIAYIASCAYQCVSIFGGGTLFFENKTHTENH